MKKCSRCKKVKKESEYLKDKRSSDGIHSHCRDCQHFYVDEWKKRHNGKFYFYAFYRSPKGKYLQIKAKAKWRNIPFYLTFKFYKTLWGKPCYYCGSEIKTTGLDRVNNKRGYYKDNIAPCCIACNMSKSNHSLEYFLKNSKRLNALSAPH